MRLLRYFFPYPAILMAGHATKNVKKSVNTERACIVVFDKLTALQSSSSLRNGCFWIEGQN
jgi:hypothetical protein